MADSISALRAENVFRLFSSAAKMFFALGYQSSLLCFLLQWLGDTVAGHTLFQYAGEQ